MKRLILIFGLMACTGAFAQSKKKMNSFLGKSKNDLFKAFGFPLKDVQDSTMEMIVFGDHTIMPRSIYYPDGVDLWEYKMFYIEHGSVTAWRKSSEIIPPERLDMAILIAFFR